MKIKATLFVQKTVWIEEEIEINIPNAQSSDDTNEIIDAVEEAFNNWADKQEDCNDPAVTYELDDYGWEELDGEISEG